MPKSSIRGFVAIFSLLLLAGIISLLFFQDPPESAHDTLALLVGFVGGMTTAITSFYFGSSEEKTDGR